MAKARINMKKNVPIDVNLPECPVCLDNMSAPIYQCQSGHSLCSTCTSNLCPPICPICRQAMTQMRNWQLEEMIAKAKHTCPNKSSGCVYVLTSQEVDEHLKECIYREMVCPLGAVFGKCAWKGRLNDMLQHFKDRHPDNCNISTDSDIELDNISVTEDDRHVFLLAQGRLLFIVTVKIDTIQKVAYWIVQHIGSKKTARQHIYEIHITSKLDSNRQVTFFEYCFNDAIKAEEIFQQGKCGIMPLSMVKHFIRDRKLSFKILIKRIPFNPKQKFEKGDGGHQKMFVGKGPKGSASHESDNSGPRTKSPGPSHIRHRNMNNRASGGAKQNNHPLNFQ